jgi:type IV pilus assembly protein PilY1
MVRKCLSVVLVAGLLATAGLLSAPVRGEASGPINEENIDYASTPPFITTVAPPLVVLVMGRDHKLYFEAYDDHSDLDGDGVLETTYSPAKLNYYGYFDCDTCYTYNRTNGYFEPAAKTTDPLKKCTGLGWSGDFLNYLTMSRMDCVRKVLYGGYRSTDTNSDTVLERAYVTRDAHSWGKEYVSTAVNGYNINDYSPYNQPSTGNRHLIGTGALTQDGAPKLVILKSTTHRIWDWVSKERPMLDTSCGTWDANNDEYIVRVKVATSATYAQGSGYKRYPGGDGILGTTDDVFKPIGILQRYSEDPEKMYFALVTGSYTNNLQGGILRSKAHLITDSTDPDYEINAQYGTIINANGIIKTLDKLKLKGYCYCDSGCSNGKQFTWIDDSTHTCNCTTICSSSFGEGNCGSHAYEPCPNGLCNMWGNPIAEIMYEGLRYIAGETSPTSQYTTGVSAASSYDTLLGLPAVTTWTGINPYNKTGTQVPWCGQPFMLVISDINPSYDSDQLPGALFQWDITGANKGYGSTGWNNSSLTAHGETSTPSLNVATEMTIISGPTGENISGSYFIGQSGSNYDGAPTAKTVTDLGQVRGLTPEEPTKQGSYYSAAVSYFGHKYAVNAVHNQTTHPGTGKVTTFAVALASPLPKIEIPIAGKNIRLLPFGKSVKWSFDLPYQISPDRGKFQPTNQIADFYLDPPASTDSTYTAYVNRTYGKFRVSFEDHEQGNDFDMDALITYEYFVENASNALVTDPALGDHVRIKITSESASGSINQHLGYVISGTDHDGAYLEVMDADAEDGVTCNDTDYFLDTPPGQYPGGVWADGKSLPPTATPRRCGTRSGTEAYAPFSTERTFRTGSNPPAKSLHDPLWYAAKWGGFMDFNGNNIPDQQSEWDADGDGDPDTYFYVQNPLYLEQQLDQTFRSILERASAGAAASVISNTRSGEGAVYQAVFYPKYMNKVTWAGEVHSLLVDAYGNMREDTNNNRALDLAADKIVQFDTSNPGQAVLYTDTNADGQLTDAEKAGQTPATVTLQDVKYLWSTTPWLNGISDTNVVTQRTYASTDQKRYIFTFIPGSSNTVGMVPASGEVYKFDLSGSTEQQAIGPYLHLFQPFGSQPPGYNEVAYERAQVQFIRGQDQTGMRSRKYADPTTGATMTFRLGDVVDSTPTAVGRPAENYDLLYRDSSYRDFYTQYQKRRTVVYAGANDGMFHAFNGGFFTYDATNKRYQFSLQSQGGSETQFALGAELWAYVPFNLLPHLYWLTRLDYRHVYYCDLKPRIFDARIYDPTLPATDTHPRGWATILVGGMRLGGGAIRTDKNHDGAYASATDKTMKSAYFILDITNPEAPPTLLAEVTFPDLGYTLSYPGVVVVKSTSSDTPNNWYLAFGSGPNGVTLKLSSTQTFTCNQPVVGNASNAFGYVRCASGTSVSTNMLPLKNVVGGFKNGEQITQGAVTATVDLTNSVIDLRDGASSQPAGIYMIDLVQLARYGALKDPSGTTLTASSAPYVPNIDANAFIPGIITVDLDLDYQTDAAYYGTVSGSPASWGGKLRRIVFDDPDTSVNPTDYSTWVKDPTDARTTLIDVGKPITGLPSVGQDRVKQTWVFFGTGRYLTTADASDTSQQTFYGVKEPWTDRTSAGTVGLVDIDYNEMTWATVSTSNLLNVSNVVTYLGGTIKCEGTPPVDCTNISDLNGNGTDDFNDLQATIATKSGWFLNFPTTGERDVGQAALLGGLLTFTSYIPSTLVCGDEGLGNVWALYYETGTPYPYWASLDFGTRSITEGLLTKPELNKKNSLGKGLATTPNIHTGRETGSKAYVQTSTGSIVVIQTSNPSDTKSGKAFWLEE